ncbi:MAG: flavin reductase family protein [Archaeoglobales archaeon]|nr:flavin reductase family protein [Archaeoglobales archaeon]
MKGDVEDAYRLLHPRPVVLICAGEKPNVMACSWITPVCDEPFMLAVAIWKENYTYDIIEKTNEFTVNVPPPELVNSVWIAGTKSGRELDKISVCKLKVSRAKKVKTYVLDDCLANMECIVEKKVEAGDHVVYISKVLESYADSTAFSKVWKKDILLHLGGRDFVVFGKKIQPTIEK